MADNEQGGGDDIENCSQSNESGLNNNFSDMLNNIIGNVEDHDNDDNEVANALADIEQQVELGPPVSVHVAEAYNKAATRQLSKENAERLRQTIRVPENCTALRVPKLNSEIWQYLPARARLVDIKSQKTQAGLSTALCILAGISDEVAKNAKNLPKELVGTILKMGLDGANLIGTQFQEITMRRRHDVKPFMNPDYAGICNAQLPSSEFLFGNNLTETLKSTKAAASVIRNSTQGMNRYKPFPSTSRGGSLNYYRPFQTQRGRWNGPNRGRPNFRGQYNRQYNNGATTPNPQYNYQRRQ